MMPITLSVRVQLLILASAVSLVVGLAYLAGRRSVAPVLESVQPAPAQVQRDGSVIAEREPDAKPPAAPHVIPRGAVEERRVSVSVRPRLKLPASQGDGSGPVADPVRVDLSLVRMDSGRRVIASSPDGDVIGAMDVPIEAAAFPTSRPWAAGMSYEPARCQQTAGVWVDRDLGRVRIGVELGRHPAGDGFARLKAGVTW